MNIVPIACLQDNYAYLVVCSETNLAAIVDPSEAAPVLKVIRESGVKLAAIWSTHHHWDHVGGNEEIVKELSVPEVYGHLSDKGRIPAQTKYLETGDAFEMGSLSVRAIHIPGHTTGAVAYVVTTPGEEPAVFTGDTMFVAGCGRLFEGTPAMMHTSLASLAALEPGTRVYCGHEYTQSNLRFAAHVEPSNPALARAKGRADALRAEGKPTVPSTIADEREINPFVRVDSAEIRRTLGIAADASGADALGAIRAAKDSFK